MTLSKSSVHYKLFKYVNGDKDTTSLCLWFWSVFIGAPMKFIFYGHIGTFPIMWSINILLLTALMVMFSLTHAWDKPGTIVVLPLTIVTLISTVLAVYKARERYWSKRLNNEELKHWQRDFELPERFYKKPGKVSQLFSLVFLTISAIKYKICPIIELK